MKKTDDVISRRQFIARSAAGAVALGAASSIGWASPKTARADDAVIGANDRINVAVIGCGNMGGGHLSALVRDAKDPLMNIRIAGVCDIYGMRLDRAMKESGAKGYVDYRALLDSKDVDAVWIATPEHWHAKMCMDAMEAGKDIYCEKPMTRYWEEARDVYRCSERTGRVMQIGSQSCTDEKWALAAEQIRAGKLGKVVWSQCSFGRNSSGGEWNYGIDPKENWSQIDWEAFLGPAPWMPFDPDRFFNWRKYWDYSGGIATDLFAHSLHALCKTLEPGLPCRVSAGGGIFVHDDREVPDTFHMIVDYPTKQNIVAVSSMANSQGIETVVHGHEANMFLGSGKEIVIKPEQYFAKGREAETIAIPRLDKAQQEENRKKHPDRVLFGRGGQENQDFHRMNFLDCVRTRNQNTNCPPRLAYEVDVAIALAVDSYRENKVKLFDPVKEEVIQ